ncbi:MAG: M20/M25/M40 family metallo-hydrolase [Gemmatimonadaceae bacterium]|nr:M20/M25/M40 family metallo-hydrolase [Gemmatimonadaceae bacterium]
MPSDWTAGDETAALLQQLIRFNTTNPPGDEKECAEFLVKLFTDAGIESRTYESRPGRAQVYARIKGSGDKRPVMLLAHMDVVGVERDRWSCDPFEGVIRDGYLYGRGAIDDKGMLAANAMAMILLNRAIQTERRTLSRDVVFVATADEEAGGEWGMGWMVKNHPELLDAEFALNEGGRTRVIAGGRRYLAIQSAEKISHGVRLSARGTAGHSAVPLPDNAIFALARATARLADHIEPVHLTPITRSFFAGLAAVWPDAGEASAMRDIASGDTGLVEKAATVLSRTPVFNAVLRAGISPTILEGGIRNNVIPASAGVVLNVRTIPGQPIDDVIARIKSAIADDKIEIEVTGSGEEAPASDADSEMFTALANAARSLDPEITVVPYQSNGVTDSARLRILGINAYGILPFPMEQADEERMHGHDERIPVASLHFGTRLIYETLVAITK